MTDNHWTRRSFLKGAGVATASLLGADIFPAGAQAGASFSQLPTSCEDAIPMVQPQDPSNAMYLIVDWAGSGSYTTIQDALAAVPPGQPPGAVIVFVMRGQYAGGFSVPASVTLRGEGPRLTRILAPISQSQNGINVGTADVVIEDLEIHGQRSCQPNVKRETLMVGIAVTGPRLTVRNCYIHHTRNDGIVAVGGAADLHVQNCTIENSATNPAGTPGYHYKGIYCSGVARPQIVSNIIRGWSQAIGLWYGVVNGLVQNNRVLDNYGFEDDAHTIYRSACEDYGANAAAHGQNQWIANLIDGTTHHCIEIAQGVVGSSYINNHLRNPGVLSNDGGPWEVTGQGTQITTDILIQGNNCYSDGTRAQTCTINGPVYRIFVVGNTFTGFSPAGYGPLVVGGSAGPQQIVVQDNTFYNCYAGIWINLCGDNAVVSGNSFRSPVGGWPCITLRSGNGHTVNGNSINGGATGIEVTTGNGHQITNNQVNTRGTSVICYTANNTVAGNAIQETAASYDGVLRFYTSNATGNVAKDNIITAVAGSYAVLIDNGASQNIVQNNIVNGNVRVASSSGLNNVTSPNYAP